MKVTYTPMLRVVPLITAKTHNQSRCPSPDDRVDKSVIGTHDGTTTTTTNSEHLQQSGWIIVLSEINQTQKEEMTCFFLFVDKTENFKSFAT